MQNLPCRRAGTTTALLALLLSGLPLAAAAQAAGGAAAPSPNPASTAPAPVAAAANAAGVNSAAIDPTNLLLFSVDLDGLTVTEGLGAYGQATDPLIPFGEFTRLLDLDVDVRATEGRITGRLGEARRSLLVDIASHTARVGAQEIKFVDDDIAVTPSEIYIRSSLLTKLLPLKVTIDDAQLTFSMHALEKLPIQEKLERLANRPQDNGMAGPSEAVLSIAQPYRLFSPPGADIVLDTGARSTAPHVPFRYDVRLAGDVLYSDFQGYVASDEQGRPANATVLFTRRSLDGKMFGPLHARVAALGDVYTPGLPIGARSVSGRGFTFSTQPIAQTSVFNRIDLRGDLPPGDDVELYVNDVLRGSTNEAVNGRYEFLGVPLSPGVNVIRTVVYGQHGDRNEQVQIINVGAGLLQRGDATLDFGIVDQSQPVFRLNQPAQDASTYVQNPGLRMVGSMNYGITNFLTATFGAAITPKASGRAQQLYTTGLRTSALGLALQLDGAVDGNGGMGASIGAAGQYFGVSGVLRQAQYSNGFIDENNLGANSALALKQRTELTLDSNLKLRGRVLPVSLRLIRDGYRDGSYDLQGAARVSTSVAGILMSTGLEYGRTAYGVSPPSDSLTGYLTVSSYAAFRWQIRANLDYTILPTWRAQALSVTIDRKMSDSWSLRFAIGQQLNSLSATDFLVASDFLTKYGDLALTGEYDNSQHDWRLGAQWNFGLGYDPLARRYRLTPSGPGSGGSVVLDAFMDENGDGIRQAGEAPVPGVIVQGGATQRPYVTGANGGVYVSGMGTGPTTRLNVSIEKIDIAGVKTPPNAIDIQPRPGSVTHVPFPLQPTGDVMVKMELVRDDGKHVGLSAVRVQLVPEKGEPIELTTEFDGSAAFSGLPIGTYRLQLDPEQARKLRMRLTSDATIIIKGDGSFTPDVDAEVKFIGADDNAQIAAPAG